jgi:hypothetical protein
MGESIAAFLQSPDPELKFQYLSGFDDATTAHFKTLLGVKSNRLTSEFYKQDGRDQDIKIAIDLADQTPLTDKIVSLIHAKEFTTLIEMIQLLGITKIFSLELSEITLDDLSRYFEHKVFDRYFPVKQYSYMRVLQARAASELELLTACKGIILCGSEPSDEEDSGEDDDMELDGCIRRGPITDIAAWLFAFSWAEYVGYHHNKKTPLLPSHVANFFRYVPIGSDITYQMDSFSCNVVAPTTNLAGLGCFVSQFLYTDEATISYDDNDHQEIFRRLGLLIGEVNRRGCSFVEEPKKQTAPKVWHLNHLRLYPAWPTFNPPEALSRTTGISEFQVFLKSRFIPRLPYPKFDRKLWVMYPPGLKERIFTLICCSKHRKTEFPLPKDLVLAVLLNYVVFNYYQQKEEKIMEWIRLGETCKHSHTYFPTETVLTLGGVLIPKTAYNATDHLHLKLASAMLGYQPELNRREFLNELLVQLIQLQIDPTSTVPVAEQTKVQRPICSKALNNCYSKHLPLSFLFNGFISINDDGSLNCSQWLTSEGKVTEKFMKTFPLDLWRTIQSARKAKKEKQTRKAELGKSKWIQPREYSIESTCVIA